MSLMMVTVCIITSDDTDRSKFYKFPFEIFRHCNENGIMIHKTMTIGEWAVGFFFANFRSFIFTCPFIRALIVNSCKSK